MEDGRSARPALKTRANRTYIGCAQLKNSTSGDARAYTRAGAAARLGRISPMRRICAPTPRSFSSMFS